MSDASVGLAVVRSSDREVVAICGGSFGPRPTERSLHFLAVIWASPDRDVVAFSCTYSGKVGGGREGFRRPWPFGVRCGLALSL